MKTSVLSIFLFLIPLVGYGQKSYAPLNAEWKYEGPSLACTGNHMKFTVEQEITIGGKDCSIIYSYKWIDNLDNWIWTQDSLIVWEEADKVYFLEDTTFYLLYDFDVEVNDLVSYYDPINRGLFSATEAEPNQLIPNQINTVIAGVEEIEISGQTLRKYYTTPFYQIEPCKDLGVVIENIGSTSQGITGQGCYYITKGCFGSIVCYRNESISYDSGFLSCDSFTSVDNLVLSEQVNVYPNPAQNLINFEGPDDLEIISIKIFSTSGRLVSIHTSSKEIDITNLERGVYFVELTTDNGGTGFKKIVKQ